MHTLYGVWLFRNYFVEIISNMSENNFYVNVLWYITLICISNVFPDKFLENIYSKDIQSVLQIRESICNVKKRETWQLIIINSNGIKTIAKQIKTIQVSWFILAQKTLLLLKSFQDKTKFALLKNFLIFLITISKKNPFYVWFIYIY